MSENKQDIEKWVSDNRRRLYDKMLNDYDLPDYDTWCANLSDPEKRKRTYDATVNKYDFSDFSYDEYSEVLGFGESVGEQPAQPNV